MPEINVRENEIVQKVLNFILEQGGKVKKILQNDIIIEKQILVLRITDKHMIVIISAIEDDEDDYDIMEAYLLIPQFNLHGEIIDLYTGKFIPKKYWFIEEMRPAIDKEPDVFCIGNLLQLLNNLDPVEHKELDTGWLAILGNHMQNFVNNNFKTLINNKEEN